MALLDTLPSLPPTDPPAFVVRTNVMAAATTPPVLVAMAGPVPAASYQGNTLVVDGVTYPRDASSSTAGRGFAPGRLLVSPQPGRGGEIAALMLRLGLTVERALGGDPPIGWVISVPEGFELQWQAALKRQPAVAGADVDGRMSPQPVRPGALPAGPGTMVR